MSVDSGGLEHGQLHIVVYCIIAVDYELQFA